MEEINLYRALSEMRKAEKPFSVSFIKYSKTKNTGGEIVTIPHALETGQKNSAHKNNMINFRDASVADGKHRRCWIWGITEFNGKKITW